MVRRLAVCGAALTLIAATLVAATPGPGGAITNGAQISTTALAPGGAFEWLARLVDSSGDTVCTGELIAPDWVLTAGHCGVANAGVAAIGLGLDTPVAIAETSVHPDFDPAHPESGSDLALMRLETASTRTPVSRRDRSRRRLRHRRLGPHAHGAAVDAPLGNGRSDVRRKPPGVHGAESVHDV